MKVKQGINQPWADFDEIDHDAATATEEFSRGVMSFSELQALIGAEEADDFVASLDLESDWDDPDAILEENY